MSSVMTSLTENVEEIARECRGFCRRIVSVENLRNRLPIIKWLPKYRLAHLQGDVIAGLTVGLTVVPQGLALAKVAGLPPQYGLYTAFMGCFVYTIFGTAKDVTVGPTAVMSLLVGQFGRSVKDGDATYAIILTLFAGLIQVLMSILQIGSVIDYISHPVINSFTTAAAITIAEGQVKAWLGLTDIPRDFLHELYWTLRKLPETRLWDFVLGLICIILLFLLKKLKELPNYIRRFSRWRRGGAGSDDSDERHVPLSRARRSVYYSLWLLSTARNAVVVLMAAGCVGICLSHGIEPFTTTVNITTPGLPPFKPPAFSLFYHNHTYGPTEIFSSIGFGFAVIPILGLVETMAVGKAFARKNKYTIDANQELLAMGFANVFSSFVSAFPVTGSFSRTAVNSQSGAQTTAGGIVTGTLVILSLQFLTPYVHFIPDATLAAVIIMAVSDLVDFSLLRKLWRIKRLDIIPWIVTFLSCLLINVEWGIMIGVAVSILFLLYPSGRPKITVVDDDETIQQRSPYAADVMVLCVNQGLVFPAVDHLQRTILSKLRQNPCVRHIVMDFCHVTSIDYTTIEGVSLLLEELYDRGSMLVFCNLQTEVLAVLLRAKLDHFYYSPSIEEAIRTTYTSESPTTDPTRVLLNDSLRSDSSASSANQRRNTLY